MSKNKQRRKRLEFSPEFKSDAGQLCLKGERSIAEVARDLDLTETALRNWVMKAREGVQAGPSSNDLTPSEGEELLALQRENRELKQGREILERAAAFFAKEQR